MKALMIRNVLRCDCVIRIALSSYLSAHCVAHQHRLRSLHLKARLHHSMHCCRRLLRIFCMCLRCLADVLLPSSPPPSTTAPACQPSRSRRRCVSYNNKLLGLSPNKSYNVLELGLFALQFTTTVVVCRLHLYI